MIAAIQSAGGTVTHADLENYHVRVEPALVGTYRDRRIYTAHAPSSGPILLYMLNLLERYDLADKHLTDLTAHRLVEAMKCKFEYRSQYPSA